MSKKDFPGRKFDEAKVRLDLLPADALIEIGKVLTLGANKYGDRNWESGINYSRCWGALLRHGFAWFRGEDRDPETGLSHLAHLSCNALFLLAYVLRPGTAKFDDRPVPLIGTSEVCVYRHDSDPLPANATVMDADVGIGGTDGDD